MAQYIDRVGGNDANGGTSWADAWASLDKMNGSSTTVYIKNGVYFLTKDITIIGSGQTAPQVVGVGQVVIKNPLNKRLNVVLDNAYGGTSARIFKGINFSLFEDQVPLMNVNYSQSDALQTVSFVNCSFFGKLIDSITGFANMGRLTVNQCTVLDGMIIPASTSDGSALTNFLYCASSVITVTQNPLTNSTSGILASGSVVIPSVADLPSMRGSYIQKINRYCKANETTFNDWPQVNYDNIPFTDTAQFTFNALSTGWIDDVSYEGDGAVAVTDTTQYGINLSSGTSARVISPVYEMFDIITIRSFPLLAMESEGAPGSNAVLDSDQSDSARTLEYRVSDTEFLPTDVTPAWAVYTRGTPISASGKFLQIRVTFVTTAQ